MLKLYSIVRKKISDALPNKFGLIFDGWSCSSSHYISIVASFPNKNGKTQMLLGFNLLQDITNQNAQNHVTTIEKVLLSYGKSTSNVSFIVADNTNLNPCIARLMKVPFIGCYSHKLNLAVNKYIKMNINIIDKADKVMHLLRTNINFGLLQSAQLLINPAKSTLAPIVRNATRWTSTHDMIERYIKLKIFFDHDLLFGLKDYFLSHDEYNELLKISKVLSELNVYVKILQKDNLTLDVARDCFDSILCRFSEITNAFNLHLTLNSGISNRTSAFSPYFESGVIKVLRGEEPDEYEKEDLSFLLKPNNNFQINIENQNNEDDIFSILKDHQMRKQRRVDYLQIPLEDRYEKLYHVLPTSNCCERYNSMARLEKPYTRMRTSHMMFEVRMMLKSNSFF